ncbi:MAG: PQQ-binding-like beta-propeller repeat protein [Candidatus Woesearchaeota archaeon]
MNKITFAFKSIMNQKVGRLEEKWKMDSGSLLLSSPVVEDIDGDGTKEIIFGTKDGKIISIDANGQIKWTFSAQEKHTDLELMFLDAETSDSINGTPYIDDINWDGKKEIVFGTEAGKLYALDGSGKTLWTFSAKGPIRGASTIQKFSNKETGILFGSSDKNLYFLNGKGQAFWTFEADSEIESCPAFFIQKQPMIVFGTNSGKIYALDIKGKPIWTFKTKGKIIAQPVMESLTNNSEPIILIGSTDGILYCLNANGEKVWTYETDGAICSKAAVADINDDGKKEIIFGSCDNCVYALDYTGKKLWNYETDFWVVASPIVSDLDNDGKMEIIAGSYDHNIYVLDSEGSYMLDYVPGVSGIVTQTGSYGEAITKEPGKTQGKKIWQYQAEGIIVGCAYISESKNIIINTDSGKVKNLIHKKE